MNILVVNEERVVADAVANMLNQHGYHALPLSSRLDALTHLGKIHFDLALVAVAMPHMAGLRLGERLCDMNNPFGHWIHVIYMATPETAEILESQSAGFECLSLPLDLEELLRKVRQIEGQRETELQKALEFLKGYEP